MQYQCLCLDINKEEIMSIRKRTSKRAPGGYSYQVYFSYHDRYTDEKKMFTKIIKNIIAIMFLLIRFQNLGSIKKLVQIFITTKTKMMIVMEC